MDLKQVIGFSPLLYGVKKIKTKLFFQGGGTADEYCVSDDYFFEMMTETAKPDSSKPHEFEKPARLTQSEINNLMKTKAKLTKEQKLVKSLIEEISVSKHISAQDFQNAREMYEFRRKYKFYIRLKRLVPLGIVAPFTTGELSRMAYCAALGSKSLALTLPGLIGYSLPAFYFFHMSSYYAPDKLKPVCQFCKYSIGAPFWIIGSVTDGLLSPVEEAFAGEEIPIDLSGTGGTIPGELGDIDKLMEVVDQAKDFAKEQAKDVIKKSY